MKIDFEDIFSRVKPTIEIPHVSIEQSAIGLVKGLEAFIGKERYQWIEAYDHVADWLSDNRNKGLLMVGGNGTGKTTMEKILCVILGKYFTVLTGTDVRLSMVSAYDIKSAWDNYFTYQIIDDIGKEENSKVYGENHDYFAQIVDRAEQRKQLLICSTNLSKDELKAKYDGRTLDRMGNVFRTVFFKGESMRG